MNLNIQRGWNQIDYNTKRNRHVKETTPTPRIRDRDKACKQLHKYTYNAYRRNIYLYKYTERIWNQID